LIPGLNKQLVDSAGLILPSLSATINLLIPFSAALIIIFQFIYLKKEGVPIVRSIILIVFDSAWIAYSLTIIVFALDFQTVGKNLKSLIITIPIIMLVGKKLIECVDKKLRRHGK
jgi:hypothetical protein